MDYCSLGSVRHLMETTKKTLNEEQIAFICRVGCRSLNLRFNQSQDTLRGLSYMHHQGMIHRDVISQNLISFQANFYQIKTGNLLLNEKGTVMIGKSHFISLAH